jgi:hypothetical protein
VISINETAGSWGTNVTVSLEVSNSTTVARAIINIRPNGFGKQLESLTLNAAGTAGKFAIADVRALQSTIGTSNIRRVGDVSAHGSAIPFSIIIADVGQIGDPSDMASISAAAISNLVTVKNADINYTGNAYMNVAAVAASPLVGNLENRCVIRGDFFGSIQADSGFNDPFEVAGAIGSPTQPAIINCRGNIELLQAAAIYANISTVRTDSTDKTGRIVAQSGPFVGSLTTSAIGLVPGNSVAQFSIAGDLDADVTVAKSIARENGTSAAPLPVITVGGEFKAGRTIRIGENLQGPDGSGFVGGIKVNTVGGLKGQVVINNTNTTGNWIGPVSVGTLPSSLIVLDPAAPTSTEYPTLNTALGNGSVGLVPFQVHTPQSDAINAGLVSSAFSGLIARRPLVVEFYGPVSAGTTGAPARVIIPIDPSDTQCFPFAPSGIDVTARCDITVSQTNPRQLLINVDQFAELPGTTYIVVPATTPNLFCKDVGNGSVPVANFL